VVAVHALLRAKPLRRRDLAGRRQFLRADARSPPGVLSGLGAAAPAVGLVRLTPRAAPLKGVPIRAGSFAGTAFPPTSWLADSPRPLPDDSYRLELCGLGARPLRLPAGGAQAGHARPHRRLQLAPALDGCAPRPQAQAGRPAAPREPRARDLPHRLPLELRPPRRPRPAARHQLVLAEMVGHENHWKISVVQSPPWRRTSWARARPSGRA
jgi:hypothetical protein